jgi:tetratricopeptide (TPR) repeat protein
VQVLRRLLEADGGRALLREAAGRSNELSELLPELAGAKAAPRGARASDAGHGRFMLFDAVSRVLARAGRGRPLVIVLEDLQWADPPSLRVLEHLAFEAASEPILVLGSVREAFRERGHPLDRTLGVLRQQERTIELALGGFSRREVAALLARKLGRAAPSDLISELFARTEGVPLFLREAIRLLTERGVLERPEKIPRSGIALPGRALDLIRRALDALSDPASSLVAAAAVLGREFTLAAAAEVAELERDAALDLFDEATRAGVLEASPDDAASWRFTHALFQEAAYAGLEAGERVRLHLRAARRLERDHADDVGTVMAELAHHHHRALAVGDAERAFACAQRAAEQATQLGAWEQAAQHYEQAVAALAHVRPLDPERRLGVLLALGETCRLSGERTRRREVLAQAMSLARELGRTDDLARAAIGFSDLQDWGVRDDAARLAVTEALEAVGDAPGSARVRLLTRLAYFDVHAANETARLIAREAAELARGAGDPEALQDALYVLHFALGGPDHTEERAQLGEEIVRVARGSRSGDRALISLLDLASDRVMLGDAAGARVLRARADGIAGERPPPAMRWNMGVYATGIALLEGRFDEAATLMRDTYVLGRRAEHPYAKAVYNGHRVVLAHERGDAEEMLEIFERAIGAREGPQHWVQAMVARARLALGREAEARTLFESLARDGFADISRNLRWTGTIVELAVLCAELDDAKRAQSLQKLLEQVEHQHGVMPMAICYGGPVRYALARLSETLGRREDAVALYEDALAAAGALGARPMQARIALQLGQCLSPRDRRRAKPLLEESAGLATELGMAAVAAHARATLSE